MFCRLVANFTRIGFSLNKKLERGEHLRFELDNEKRKDVNIFKDKLGIPHSTALPHLHGKYIFDKDACETQMECDLLQNQEETCLNTIGYWSRSLCDAERI